MLNKKVQARKRKPVVKFEPRIPWYYCFPMLYNFSIEDLGAGYPLNFCYSLSKQENMNMNK